jgi:hypothetical protein
MEPATFFAKFDQFAEASNAVAKLRELVLERNQDTLMGSNHSHKAQKELNIWS